MIKKIKGKFVVLSEKTGRRFGTYDTLEEAKKRLRQTCLPAGRLNFSNILNQW